MNEKQKKELNSVVFFLGAGASVGAEVPTTYQFLGQFVDRLPEGEQKDFARGIILNLEKGDGSGERRVDIELFIETLDSLGGGLGDVGAVYDHKKSLPQINDGIINSVLEGLKNFVREKALVPPKNVRYLDALWSVGGDGPLDIFSTNYDTAIEQLCEIHRKRYSDGFQLEWRPEDFERLDLDIRLYKLHGSVLWYESEHARYLKIPISPENKPVNLFTGEKAKSLMIYPMRKWQYAEPLLEIMMFLKRRVEDSNATKHIVVGGYSFRDVYIKKLFWDAFRKNKDLIMILIDPKAVDIYEEQLKEYQPGLPSSMMGRVVCWPGAFEKVLPLLRNFILTPLREGQRLYARTLEMEQRGDSGVDWDSVAQHFLAAGFYDAYLNVEQKAPDRKPQSECVKESRILGFAALLAARNGDFATCSEKMKKLSRYLSRIVSTVEVRVSLVNSSGGMELGMELKFEYPTRAKESGRNLENAISEIASFGNRLVGCMLKGSNPTTENYVEKLVTRFSVLSQHLSAIEDHRDIAHRLPGLYGSPQGIFGLRAEKAAQKLHSADWKKSLPNGFQEDMIKLETEYLKASVSGLISAGDIAEMEVVL